MAVEHIAIEDKAQWLARHKYRGQRHNGTHAIPAAISAAGQQIDDAQRPDGGAPSLLERS
jgi:hypothetical protein